MSALSLEFALWLFGVCLPTTMIAWTLAVLGAGRLRNPDDQPRSFRFIAAAVRLFISERASQHSPDRIAIAGGIVFWAGANGPLLFVLVKRPYDLAGMLLLVAYVVVQAIWLQRIRRAVVRSRTGQGGD